MFIDRAGIQCKPSADDVATTVIVCEVVPTWSTAVAKPTYPRRQPKMRTAKNPPLPVVGNCGKTGPAEIHLIPLHVSTGALSTPGNGVGVGVGVGVAVAVGVAAGTVGVGAAGVDTLAPSEAPGWVVGDGEATSAPQPAMRAAATSPIATIMSRRGWRS